MTGDPLAGPLWMLLALVALWLATSAVVASVAVRLSNRVAVAPPLLEPEAWMGLATSGAAVGGFVGVALAAPSLAVGHALPLPALASTTGMVLGAAFACGAAGLALWMREG